MNPGMRQQLAVRLADSRQAAGLTMEQVSELMGVNANVVWRWEAGRVAPMVDRLPDLADLYRVSVDWLLGRTEDREQIDTGTLRNVEDSIQFAAHDLGAVGERSEADQPSVDADRELVMNEASLALTSLEPELSNEAIRTIADFILFVHEREERERLEGQGP